MADKKDLTARSTFTVEELEAKLQEAQKALAEKEQQINALQSTKDPSDFTGLPIEGTFTLVGESPSGEETSQTYRFKPGYVGCFLENGDKVPSEALMKLANDGEIEADVAAKYPALVTLGKEGARNWLSTLILQKRATFLIQVASALLLLLLSFAPAASAQVGAGFNINFWKDTIKNQDTVYFNVPRALNDNAVLDAIWQFSYAGVSGTPVLYIQIQERSINHANAWSIVSTDTINASKKTVWRRFEPKGTEQRVFVRSPSGSQVTRPLGMVRYFRKYVFP